MLGLVSSLLGENDGINAAVDDYFDDLYTREYISKCSDDRDQDTNTCRDNHFLLEAAFLRRFNIQDVDNLKVFSRKQEIWIPYISSDIVHLDVRLQKQSECNMFFCFNGKYHSDYAVNTFKIKRQSGSWVVDEVLLSDHGLKQSYEKLKREIRFDKYISFQEQSYLIKPSKIVLGELTRADSNLLKYSLQKATSYHSKR